MSSPSEEAVERVFGDAVEIKSREERSAYLDKACAGDAVLRAEVEALLEEHDAAGNFLETPALGQDAALGARPLTEGPGTVVGRYKLLEQIGEGGMGVVFMAEQEEPMRRTVALKIIKPGMDTRQTLARFEAERQALALMDHPNIARVLDAGATQTGRPYFVMELAKGVPLTEYCDANRLSTPERLALFIEVCHAVQHAHQKGIIHRDLKPSNVLVTLHDGKPVPKIIDFGVAKATSQRLTEKTMFTSYGQMIGTPAYMSPEQAEMGGLDVDTRSDIYALGALLYELLTGTTPFDEKHLRSAGYQEIQRIIREVEPLKPSTRLSNRKDTLASVAASRRTDPARLARLVRGDLDWIVMKTLEKDRARRYETADGLVLDIQHHLAHEPVLAGPPGAAYRARKFLRRHRTGVAAGLLVFLALGAGLAAATVGLLRARDSARVAEQEADRATQEAAKAEAVTRFFQETLAFVDPQNARGREVTVRAVFDRAAKNIGTKFAGQPLVEAAVRETLGTTYLALGDYAAGHAQLSSAFGIRRQILGEEHPDTLSSMMNLGNALNDQGKAAEAEQMHRQVLEVRERVLGKEHPGTLASMVNLGNALHNQGKYAEAEQMYRQVLEAKERVLGKEHPDTLASMMNLANASLGQGKSAQAEQMYRQVLGIQERVLGKEHPDTLTSMMNLASALLGQGESAQAEQMYRQVLGIQERVLGKEHPHTLISRRRWAEAAALLGIAYPPPVKPVTPEVRAAWQGEMQRRARAIKAAAIEQGKQVPVDILPEPLWRYDQPGKQEGSLWACGRTGRPFALVGMEFNQGLDGSVWGFYEFVSLSSGLVTAAGEGDWKWWPKKPAPEFKPLPDGPAPAEDVAGRLGQMKELLRRFTASENPLPGKELALLEAPVHRYADPERGLLDGAVFVFANGTNPEVILLLELRRADKASPPQWQYALARMSAAELWVNLDGTEVWRRPVANPKPEDEYALFGAPYLPK